MNFKFIILFSWILSVQPFSISEIHFCQYIMSIQWKILFYFKFLFKSKKNSNEWLTALYYWLTIKFYIDGRLSHQKQKKFSFHRRQTAWCSGPCHNLTSNKCHNSQASLINRQIDDHKTSVWMRGENYLKHTSFFRFLTKWKTGYPFFFVRKTPIFSYSPVASLELFIDHHRKKNSIIILWWASFVIPELRTRTRWRVKRILKKSYAKFVKHTHLKLVEKWIRSLQCSAKETDFLGQFALDGKNFYDRIWIFEQGNVIFSQNLRKPQREEYFFCISVYILSMNMAQIEGFFSLKNWKQKNYWDLLWEKGPSVPKSIGEKIDVEVFTTYTKPKWMHLQWSPAL